MVNGSEQPEPGARLADHIFKLLGLAVALMLVTGTVVYHNLGLMWILRKLVIEEEKPRMQPAAAATSGTERGEKGAS